MAKVNLNAIVAGLAEEANQVGAEGATPEGPAKVKSELMIQLEGVPSILEAYDASIGQTPFGAFAESNMESDPSRKNHALAWVSAWTQFAASKTAINEGVTGYLVETHGGHRRAPLSQDLAAAYTGAIIAAAKAGRVVNLQVGPPKTLASCDPVMAVAPEYTIQETAAVWTMQTCQSRLPGKPVIPAGLALLYADGVTATDRRALCSEELYADESDVVKGILAEYPTAVGFWKEADRFAAACTGELSWDPEEVQNKHILWSMSTVIKQARTTWSNGRQWKYMVLPDNGFVLQIAKRKSRNGGTERRS